MSQTTTAAMNNYVRAGECEHDFSEIGMSSAVDGSYKRTEDGTDANCYLIVCRDIVPEGSKGAAEDITRGFGNALCTPPSHGRQALAASEERKFGSAMS